MARFSKGLFHEFRAELPFARSKGLAAGRQRRSDGAPCLPWLSAGRNGERLVRRFRDR